MLHQQLLHDVYGFNKTLNPKETNRLIPWLIGVTGSGKTFTVRKFSEQIGLPMKHIILQGISELEFLGIPANIDGKTIWGKPEWFTESPSVYFFDEIDKAHPEILSVILSLVSDYQFRNHVLHPDSAIVFASQPIEPEMFEGSGNSVVETLKALRSRSFFVPVQPEHVLEALFPKTSSLLKGLMENDWKPPLPDTISIRQLNWLKEYAVYSLKKNKGFDSEKLCEELSPIVKGITTNYSVVISAILDEIAETVSLTKQTVSELENTPIWSIPKDELIIATNDLLQMKEINYSECLFVGKTLLYLRSIFSNEEFFKQFPCLKETKRIVVDHPYSSHEEFAKNVLYECGSFYATLLQNKDVIAEMLGDNEKTLVAKISDEKMKELQETLSDFVAEFGKLLGYSGSF